MFPELSGKRLLILGGSLWKKAIKDFAVENNITLVATGNDQSAGIFEIADEKYSVNSTDSESMRKLIKDAKIDGVYMGGSEPVIEAACVYLNELGLPCYCTREQWNYLQNKANLKELYKRFDIPVATQYHITDDFDASCLSASDYPVITKPVDGSGSNGFSVCHNYVELKTGYELAKSNSRSGKVLVEKFVPNDSIVAVYRMSEGKLHYCGIENKYPVYYSKQGTYVAGMHIFESSKEKEFRRLYEEKLQKMFSSVGIKEGPIWIEVFLDGDKYCFNEIGFRYSGSVTIWPTQYISGYNEVASDIYYALTGKSKIEGFTSLIPTGFKRKKKYCMYSIHLHPGTIDRVEGLDKLSSRANVVSIPTTKEVGMHIYDTGSVGQVFAFVHFVFDTFEELSSMIETIHQELRVYSEDGVNMVNRMVDLSKAYEREALQ